MKSRGGGSITGERSLKGSETGRGMNEESFAAEFEKKRNPEKRKR